MVSLRRTVPASASMIQSLRSRGGRSRARSGSSTLAASAARVQPVLRMALRRMISITNVSPGSAPVTWIGPFIGLGPRLRAIPSLS